jgi:hypothetical protein
MRSSIGGGAAGWSVVMAASGGVMAGVSWWSWVAGRGAGRADPRTSRDVSKGFYAAWNLNFMGVIT